MIHVTISGRLGADSEMRTTGSGQQVLNFRVACDHGFGDSKSTTWVRCALWGKRGEKLQEHLVKGQAVVVRGELWTEEYNDKLQVQAKVDEIELVGGRPGGSSGESSSSGGGKKSGGKKAAAEPDDDLPF